MVIKTIWYEMKKNRVMRAKAFELWKEMAEVATGQDLIFLSADPFFSLFGIVPPRFWFVTVHEPGN